MHNALENQRILQSKHDFIYFWLGTHISRNQKFVQQSLNLRSLHLGLLANVGKQNTPTHSRGHRDVLPVVLQWVQSVCSGRLVMSGQLGVRGLLLLWASACLCLPWLARGALVISGEQEAPQVRSWSYILQAVYSSSFPLSVFCDNRNKQTIFVLISFFCISGHVRRCQNCAGI